MKHQAPGGSRSRTQMHLSPNITVSINSPCVAYIATFWSTYNLSLDEHEGHLRWWTVFHSFYISVCPCANEMLESPTYRWTNKITKNFEIPTILFFFSLKITCFAKQSETSFSSLNGLFFFYTHLILGFTTHHSCNTPRLLVYSGKRLVNLENSLDEFLPAKYEDSG